MKSLRKIFSIALILVMALGLLAGCNNKPEGNGDNNGGEVKVDTSWYKDSETTFTLTKVNQFMGLAELAKTKNFEGKTIKLDADIKLNEVDATIITKWRLGSAVPENVWTPLGNKDIPFAGNFDGQGHTISGLYVSAAENGAGLFGTVAYDISIGNFRLVDSYVKNTQNYTGVIGYGIVKNVENIYTNLIIDTYGTGAAGIIGWYDGGYGTAVEDEQTGINEKWEKSHMTINKCWFDGEISAGSYANGGIIGGQGKRAKVTLINCLSTGTITGAREDGYDRIGGLFGWMNWEAEYNIINCLAVGTLTSTLDTMTGALIGDYGAQPAGPTITNSYGVGKKVIGNDQRNLGLNNKGILKTQDELKSATIETLFPKLEGETESPWQAVEGSTPILKGMK